MIVNCYLLNISVSRRSRRYVVHKAIIIVQQVKLKLLFVWFPVLKAQPVDVPRSIKTQLSEPAGHDMTVAVPQPDIKELLFCHKTLCHYASRHFIIYEPVSYTHLDVYKRQVRMSPSSIFAFG